ncbi:hypothetical protein WQ53_15305 [Pseudoxanthomonas suwonensis]|uniref:Uncharacterized protein n=1 Tax=Pseudoxanthomonas suwonensis TaxID=314722 RepID=A0A0E3Z4F1_9GAMM|nr:hypothetical protein WQ53_15305 [Pseudoxanthomonas suwonensis]
MDLLRKMVLSLLLVAGVFIVLDPFSRYVGRVHGEVVQVEGRGRFSGPSITIRVRLESGAIFPVTVAQGPIKEGDVVTLLVHESWIFKRRDYVASME